MSALFRPGFCAVLWCVWSSYRGGCCWKVHLENENRRKEFGSLVRYVDVVRTQSLWGFHLDKEANFLKIGVAIPAMVASSRNILSLLSFYSYSSSSTFDFAVKFP